MREISSGSSSPSTPRRPAELGWGCRSAGRSSRATGASCGRVPMSPGALYFSSPCPARYQPSEVLCTAKEVAMAASTALRSIVDIESFMVEYYSAWGGTDEDRIMSYYADNVTVQIPGSLIQGKSAVREQFVRPFITAFPGNRHFVKNIIFGRDVAVIEFTFKAEHKGPFAGRAATDARIELPGCGVYEYDSARRQIAAARIYFDVGTLLKQIIEQHGLHAPTAAPTGTMAAPMEHLDLATVIAVSQVV